MQKTIKFLHPDNQTDIKSKIIEMSGCDVYVVAEVDTKKIILAQAPVLLFLLMTHQLEILFQIKLVILKFETDDTGRLVSKAVDKCMEEFIATMNMKFCGYSKKWSFCLG